MVSKPQTQHAILSQPREKLPVVLKCLVDLNDLCDIDLAVLFWHAV